MAHKTLPMIAFNRGLVSRLGLSRQDVKRIALSAQVMRNWMARVLGSMSIRPGTGYLGSTKSDAAAKFLEFVFSTTDKALVELTDSVARVWVNDAVITRTAVSTAILNGTFTTNLNGWTDSDEAGGVSQWVTPGYMELLGTGTAAAIRDQQITVVAPDLGVEHAIRIVVARGPVMLRVGSTMGSDEYIKERELKTGTHSLSLTPTGFFFIRMFSRLNRVVWVDSCTIEAAGTMELPAPWLSTDLDLVRADESADVIFVACFGRQQRRIERTATRSWSVVLYQSDDGPFRVLNTGPGTITPSVISGNGTLTSSVAFFRSTHVGALFAIASVGQTVTKSMAVLNDATGSIKVTETGTDRIFTITLTGLTATGNTVVLQRSFDNAVWAAVSGSSWTADVTTTFNDGLSNQEVYYRLLCSVYASGTTIASLIFALGSIRGICRVTEFTSSTLVPMEVLKDFGATTASADWEEGQWSDFRGWPSAVRFDEGRLWWAGKDSIVGSVSDAFESFDNTVVGDSGPINRTIGGRQVDTINWILDLQRMIIGGQAAEYSCRSSSLDEPLTPTNFQIKKASTQGSAAVPAVSIDNQGIYVQRGGTRVFTLVSTQTNVGFDYSSTNLCAIIPEIGLPNIVRMAVQRQPDTRVHCIRSDGTAAILIFDSVEQVTCWVEYETDGLVEDVVVLPGDVGDDEDHVYYCVKRTINGSVKRFLERWAFQSTCIGGAISKLADSFVLYNGAPTTVITGLGHLEGEQVCVWADGVDLSYDSSWNLVYTVTGGQITLPAAASQVVVGLYYEAQYQSGKFLELATQGDTPLGKMKAVRELGLIMADVHPKGIRYGRSFTEMRDMPGIENGRAINSTTMRAEYDEDPMMFPGSWSNDERLFLLARASRPVTVLSAVATVEIES